MHNTMRQWIGMLLIVGTVSSAVLADELILESGERIRGEVSVEGDVYTIVAEDGSTRTYTKDQVKRTEWHADVSPTQALAMLDELQQLVIPALTQDEPRQFEWLAKIRRTTSSYEYTRESQRYRVSRNSSVRYGNVEFEQGGSASASRTTGGGRSETEVRDTAEREMKIDAVFANEWNRYINQFEILEDHPRLTALVSRRRDSRSLGDFATRAPDEYDDAKLAINRALRALEDVFEAARTSNQLVRGRLIQETKLTNAIMKAQNKFEAAKDKVATAKNKKRAEKTRDRLEAKVNELKSYKITKLATLQRAATESMADFAMQESLALNEIQHAREFLSGKYETVTEQ